MKIPLERKKKVMLLAHEKQILEALEDLLIYEVH
jgi:hypothetical protein